jgi:hypothetical protein
MEDQQLQLAFAEAEGSYSERQSTLLNALRSLPQGRIDRNVVTLVLRVFEATAGATRPEGVPLSMEEICDRTPQGLWSSIDTANRVVKRCLEMGILTRRRSHSGGRQGKNHYWIAVGRVIEMAGGICRQSHPFVQPQNAPPPPQSAAPPPQNAGLEKRPLNSAQRHLQKVFTTLDENPATAPAGGAPHCTNEEQEHNLPMYHNQTTNGVGTRSGSSTGPAAVSGAVVGTVAGVAACVAAAVQAFGDPAEQKTRLVRRIQQVVDDPQMNPYVARAAADLVVFHEVPLADLEKILADVTAMREAGSLLVAGAFFHSKARTLAGRHGKPWPKGKPQVQENPN